VAIVSAVAAAAALQVHRASGLLQALPLLAPSPPLGPMQLRYLTLAKLPILYNSSLETPQLYYTIT